MAAERICDVGQAGMVFPAFGDSEQEWPAGLRAVLYGVGMVYFFIGVAIIADIFMASIEKVTSKRTTRLRADGRKETVNLWNETVSTLTLMALGSSAPEIFLSVIDTFKKSFHFGALGPATIVGSASFNLLVIIAVCIVVIPSSETRIIKNLPAFYITAFFSMVAYLWMAIMLIQISPSIVEVWEACVTFLLLPVLVYVSYKVDRGDANPLLVKIGMIGPEEEEEEEEQSGNFISFSAETTSVPASMEAQTLDIAVTRRGDVSEEASCSYSLESVTAVPGHDYEEAEGTIEFEKGASSQQIQVQIHPRKAWKNACTFLIVLKDAEGNAAFDCEEDGGDESAIMTVTLEAANGSSGCLKALDAVLNVDRLKQTCSDWGDNIVEALYCNGSPEEQKEASAMDWACHLTALPWKLLFCCCPPTSLCGGWACFASSLVGIGALTAGVSDLAELFGCVVGLHDIITAISFVALGTSMPDLFASLSAAREDPTADASIVNVTGSNSVNVFLGLGVPWIVASIYWSVSGPTDEWIAKYGHMVERLGPGNAAFIVESPGLGFSVLLFCYLCIIALAILHLRRKWLGCELGGPWLPKVTAASVFIFYWFAFIALASWWCLLNEVQAEDYLVIVMSMVVSLCAFGAFAIITKTMRVTDSPEKVIRLKLDEPVVAIPVKIQDEIFHAVEKAELQRQGTSDSCNDVTIGI